MLLDALDRAGLALQAGDVLAVAQKIVSKAEGRLVDLRDVESGEVATQLAEQVGKDPRLMELILRESEEVSRLRPGVIIVRHRLGFTSANAGTVGVAIGVAGLPALWDRRGETDLYGYHLQHTDVGVADEIAAAAGLLMGQAAEGLPAVLLRGLHLPTADGWATDLVRPKELDLYR